MVTQYEVDRALSLLGLAARAGGVLVGVGRTRQGLRAGEVKLLLVASDGASGQRKKVEALAHGRAFPVIELGTQEKLGRAVGVGPVSAVGVTTSSLAEEILKRVGDT